MDWQHLFLEALPEVISSFRKGGLRRILDSLVLISEHFDVAQHRPVELSKGCFFVPVLNHDLTIGQDLFIIKTKNFNCG